MNNSLGDQRMQIFSIVLQSHPQWKKAEKMLNLLMRLEEDVDRVEDEVDFKSVMIDQLKPDSQNQTQEVTFHNREEQDIDRYFVNGQQDNIRLNENLYDMEVPEITYTVKGNKKIKNSMGTFFGCRHCEAIFMDQRQLGGHTQKTHRMTL